MSPAGQRLWSNLAAARRQVRRDGILAAGAVALAAVPVALTLAWIMGTARAWSAPSAIPLVVVVAAVGTAIAVGVWAVRRWVASVNDATVAAATERGRGLPEGSVRGVLELSRALPAGTSEALYLRAEAALARELSSATPRDLAGHVGEEARRRRRRALLLFSGLAMLTAALGFVSPERSRVAWGALLNPVDRLSPPPLPAITVEPGDVELPRGAHLDVAIEAPGRSEVVLRWRVEGDVPRQRRLALSDGRVRTRITGIDAAMVYWVVAPDGAVSDTFRVTPLDPLLFSDLVVDVVYPEYLNREPERFEGEVPPLTVPEGTELRVRGRATRRLQEASLLRSDGGSRVVFHVTGDRFAGRWKPTTSGTYHWSLTDEKGGVPVTSPPPLELTVVPDGAPVVEIMFPGPDTILGPDLRQPIVADARDDNGLHSATLVSWRVSRLGDKSEPVEEVLTLDGDPERAILRAVLDARERSLLPGDELHYFVRVVDASPARQVGVSATHVLRLPGMEELRRQADEQARTLVDEAESLARSAEQLEASTRGLARQSAQSARGGSTGRAASGGTNVGRSAGGQHGEDWRPGFAQREQVRQIVENQQQMIDRVARMRERTEALQRALEAAGLQDPALQQRLAELRQLYDQLLSPELRERLEQLRNSVDEMDSEELQRALEQLAEQQEEFRRQIEQSLELMRRAALEQQMNAAVREARELAAQQQALAEELKQPGALTPERVAQQRELAERGASLQRQMAALMQQLQEQGEQSTAEQTAAASRQLEAAQQSMERAAQRAQQGQGQQASQSGAEAAQQLEQVAESLESARDAMARAWRDETRQSVEQAANEALELAQRQAELLQQMERLQQGGRFGEQQDSNAQQPQAGQAGQQGQDSGQQGQQSGQQMQPGQQGQSGNQGGSGQQSRQGTGDQGQGQQGQGQQGQGQSGRGPQGQRQQTGEPGPGGQPSGGQPGPGGSSEIQTIRAEQAALQQSLEALGRNLAETGRRSAMVNQDVSAALGRAMLSMQQTMDALDGRNGRQGMPMEEARRTIEALNRLALELLKNGEQIEQSRAGTGLQQALEQLAELAKQQGSLNGQANSLLPLDLGPRAMADQMQRMAREQREIARRLGGLNDMIGGQDDILGQLDELAREAEAIARELEGGRLTPELLARQERLFHRLLDAGRTLEREEYSNERVAERPGNVGVSRAGPLDAELLRAGPRFPIPDAEALRSLPPAYRRLVLEYFDRLNRGGDPAATPGRSQGGSPER